MSISSLVDVKMCVFTTVHPEQLASCLYFSVSSSQWTFGISTRLLPCVRETWQNVFPFYDWQILRYLV